jgi:hypothetical protein
MTETAPVVTLRPPIVVVVPSQQRISPNKRWQAKRAVLSFLVGYLALASILAVKIDGSLARVRDAEYAARRDRLLARVAEQPTRPLVLVLGSSRTVEGIRPDHVNGEAGPMLFNAGLVGSGSMLELMTYRRLKAAGVRPQAVLIEYWPVLLRGGPHAEYGRIDLPRLNPRDLPIVWDYYPDPPSVTRYVLEGQLWPAWRYRKQLLATVQPKWVPDAKHERRFTAGMDRWGWWPGVRDEDAQFIRTQRMDIQKNPFRPYLDGFSIGVEADHALRDLLAECRADDVACAFVFMPEGPAFRTLYTPDAEQRWRVHLAGLMAEFNVPLHDARSCDDFAADLPDGVHLTQGGAARFTRRLVADLPRLFPEQSGDMP